MRISHALAGFALAAPLFLAPPGLAQQESSFQPRFIAPDRDSREGFCRLRVRVDNVTDVIMLGDRVVLRTLEGRPSFDEGSECSGPMPRFGVVDFDFRKTEGPGSATLMETPDHGGGRAVIHVSDPEPGDHKYTLEFRWRSEHHDGWGEWEGGPPAAAPVAVFGPQQAITVCEDAIREQVRGQYHYHEADFSRVRVDEGRQDWIVGEAMARRADDRLSLRFECNVDYRLGRVRSARAWEPGRER
jgi:hypothetical protein